MQQAFRKAGVPEAGVPPTPTPTLDQMYVEIAKLMGEQPLDNVSSDSGVHPEPPASVASDASNAPAKTPEHAVFTEAERSRPKSFRELLERLEKAGFKDMIPSVTEMAKVCDKIDAATQAIESSDPAAKGVLEYVRKKYADEGSKDHLYGLIEHTITGKEAKNIQADAKYLIDRALERNRTAFDALKAKIEEDKKRGVGFLGRGTEKKQKTIDATLASNASAGTPQATADLHVGTPSATEDGVKKQVEGAPVVLEHSPSERVGRPPAHSADEFKSILNTVDISEVDLGYLERLIETVKRVDGGVETSAHGIVETSTIVERLEVLRDIAVGARPLDGTFTALLNELSTSLPFQYVRRVKGIVKKYVEGIKNPTTPSSTGEEAAPTPEPTSEELTPEGTPATVEATTGTDSEKGEAASETDVNSSDAKEGVLLPSGEVIKKRVEAFFGKSIVVRDKETGEYDNTWFLELTYVNEGECKAIVASYKGEWMHMCVSGEDLLRWQHEKDFTAKEGGGEEERGFVDIIQSYADAGNVTGLKRFLASVRTIPDNKGNHVPCATLATMLDEVPNMAAAMSIEHGTSHLKADSEKEFSEWLGRFPETGGLRIAVRRIVMRYGKTMKTKSASESRPEPAPTEPIPQGQPTAAEVVSDVDFESSEAANTEAQPEHLAAMDLEWKAARERYHTFTKELNNARGDYLAKLDEYESLRREGGVFRWMFSSSKLKEARAAMEEEEKRYNALLGRVYAEREERIKSYKRRFVVKENTRPDEAERSAVEKRSRIMKWHAVVLDKRIDEDVKLIEAARLDQDTNGESKNRLVRLWQMYRHAKWYNKVLIGAGAVGVGGVAFSAAAGLGIAASAGTGALLTGRRIVAGSAGVGAAMGVKMLGDRMAEQYGARKLGVLREAAKNESWETRSLAEERENRLKVNQGVRIRKHIATAGAAGAAIAAGAGASGAYAAVESALSPADVPVEGTPPLNTDPVAPPTDGPTILAPSGDFTTAGDAFRQYLRESLDASLGRVPDTNGAAKDLPVYSVEGNAAPGADVTVPKEGAPNVSPETPVEPAPEATPAVEPQNLSQEPEKSAAAVPTMDHTPTMAEAMRASWENSELSARNDEVLADARGRGAGAGPNAEPEPLAPVEKTAPLAPREYMKALSAEHFNDARVERFQVSGVYEKGASVQGELIKHLRGTWSGLTADEAGKVAFQLQGAMEDFRGDPAIAQEFKGMFGVKEDWDVVGKNSPYNIDLPKDMVESFIARFRPDLIGTDTQTPPSLSVTAPEQVVAPEPLRMIDRAPSNDEILRAEQRNTFLAQTNNNALAEARARSFMPDDQKWSEGDEVLRKVPSAAHAPSTTEPSSVIDQTPASGAVTPTQSTPAEQNHVPQNEVPAAPPPEVVPDAKSVPESQRQQLEALQQQEASVQEQLAETQRTLAELELERKAMMERLAALEGTRVVAPEAPPVTGVDTVRLGAWPEAQLKSALDSMRRATRVIDTQIGDEWNEGMYLPESAHDAWKKVFGSCNAFTDLPEVHQSAVIDAWKSLGYVDVAKLYDTTEGQTYTLPSSGGNSAQVSLSTETEAFMRSVLSELEMQYGEPVRKLVDSAQKTEGVTMASLFNDISAVIQRAPGQS